MAKSTEVDWDEVSRINFQGDICRAQRWFETANELLASAKLLEPQIEKWWVEMRAWSEDRRKRTPEYKYHAIWMMLCGFAVENLLKGALVDSLSPEDMRLIESQGRTPKWIASHRLAELATKAGFRCDSEDEVTLMRLQRAAVWSARYPVPLHHLDRNEARFSDGTRKYVAYDTASDVKQVRQLLERIRKHVGAPWTFRASRMLPHRSS